MAVDQDAAGHSYSQFAWGNDWSVRLTFMPAEATRGWNEDALRVDLIHKGKKVGRYSPEIPVASLGEVTDAVVELLRHIRRPQ